MNGNGKQSKHLKGNGHAKGMRAGDPVKFEVYPYEKIVDAIHKSKGMVTVAARMLGCTRKTVYDSMQRHPEIGEAIQQERDLIVDVAELKLADAVQKGEGWAVCFTLKCIGKGRGYVERQEVTGANGGPIQVDAIKQAAEQARYHIAEFLDRTRTAPTSQIAH